MERQRPRQSLQTCTRHDQRSQSQRLLYNNRQRTRKNLQSTIRGLGESSSKRSESKVVAPVNQGNASVARELAEVIEVRNVTVPIMHFASADSAEIIFLEDIPDDTNVNAGQDVATWTNDPLLVKSHEKIFETIWSTLQPKEAIKTKAR